MSPSKVKKICMARVSIVVSRLILRFSVPLPFFTKFKSSFVFLPSLFYFCTPFTGKLDAAVNATKKRIRD
jgi:hypothetical protein